MEKIMQASEDKELRIEAAVENDSEQLKAFLAHQPFLSNTTLDLTIDRKSSFFDKYKLQSQDYVTLKLVNSKNDIEGLVSILFRKTMLNGQQTQIGYAADLKISNSRQAIIKWPELLLPALAEEAKKRDCNYVFSVFNTLQTKAMNALIRPRSQRRNLPRYYLYKKFKFITLHGKVPFSDLPILSTIKKSTLTDNDIEPLAHYLKSKTLHRPLNFDHSPELLDFRLKNWPGFHKDNFIIAKDARNNIVGCVAPWKASQIFNVSVQKYSDFGNTLFSFSKWLSYLKFVKRMPSEGGHLPLKFLTHLHADNPDIFASLLAESFRVTSPEELLTYVHFSGVPLTLPPKSFLTSQIPFAMYTVLPPEAQLPEFLQLHKVTPPPELESVLV